ncbi:MAG: hypothetical protein RQ866_07750 [Bacteroidales bacterium]|nr:hypothetical protein [Bacteroidales bacterium]
MAALPEPQLYGSLHHCVGNITFQDIFLNIESYCLNYWTGLTGLTGLTGYKSGLHHPVNPVNPV